MKKLLVLISFIISLCSYGQIAKISKVVSSNKICPFEKQKLIIIDFWATWCEPCIAAGQQLEILQKHNKDKVFILSISDEHYSIINKSLLKRPIEMMVCADADNYTFNKYKVNSRPYAVLLNTSNQEVVWQGHPANLTQKMLDEFYNNTIQNNKKLVFNRLVETIEEQKINLNKLKKGQDVLIIQTQETQSGVSETETEVNFIGRLSDLILNINTENKFQYKIEENADLTFNLICTRDLWYNDKEGLLNAVISYFDLKKTNQKKTEIFQEIIVKNTYLLWDSSQFNWENTPTNYIIGNDRIQADNMSIKGVSSLLSKVKDEKYIYRGKNELLYDWDFHYLYETLMIEELESTFGIIFKPISLTYNQIEIKK